MEQKDDIKKQFAIETTKLAQEAFLKYKENEANKLIQIFHVTTAVIVALLALTRESLWSGIFLVLALAFIFIAYGCFYFSDFHFATVNVYSMLQAFAEAYRLEGLSEADKKEFQLRRFKAQAFRYGYFTFLGLAFLFILLSIISVILKNYCVIGTCREVCKCLFN